MAKELKTTIQQIDAAPGQRILVISDIHGHFNRLVQLLRKMEYSGDDILVIVGDLIDKGPESLRVVQYVMELSKRHPVYISMGNVDLSRVLMLTNDSPEAGEEFAEFVKWVKDYWGGGLFPDMLSDLGIGTEQVTAETAAKYLEKIREHFHEELEFLQSRPTILTAGNYLFVHGGVPTDDLSALEETDAVPLLKNDDFYSQGYRFDKYTVVTGHWPVCLNRREYEDMSPLLDAGRRILCIDGGCGVKRQGQLNGLILPDAMAGIEEITWKGYDEFPVVTALDAAQEIPASIHIDYYDDKVELLEERGTMGLFRQLSTGAEFEAPLNWTRKRSGEFHYSSYCDRFLPVEAGEKLSVVFEGEEKSYVKKRGQVGWYAGKTAPAEEKLHLMQGAPEDIGWRRERELAVYEFLDKLDISYERIDHCEANTMEACKAVDEALDAVICKNLFLCNQQRTKFYLLMMPENKKFKTKELSRQINSSRLSFAEAVYMEEFLHITPGSVSVMGLMNDTGNRVQLLIDRDVLKGEMFGCHPCMNTSSIRLKFTDLLEKFLPAVHHEPMFVELVGE